MDRFDTGGLQVSVIRGQVGYSWFSGLSDTWTGLILMVFRFE